jgi:streptogramin lyase
MVICWSEAAQPRAADAEACTAQKSVIGRKRMVTAVRLYQIALAAALGATLGGPIGAQAQSLFTEYAVPTVPGSFPLSVVTGSDGALWFVQRNSNSIGRMTTGGSVTEYPIPTIDAGVNQIALGSDNNLWFTEGSGNDIGKSRRLASSPSILCRGSGVALIPSSPARTVLSGSPRATR